MTFEDEIALMVGRMQMQILSMAREIAALKERLEEEKKEEDEDPVR